MAEDQYDYRRYHVLLALLFGVLGVVVCLVSAIVAWLLCSRLSQANENIFAKIDMSVAAARDRVLDAQKRVEESKITTEDIGERLKNWAQKEASERVVSRLEIERRTEQLAASLRQVDPWLELSRASILGVQQLFEVANSLGAPVDSSIANPLVERFDALQSQLKQSTETIDAIHQKLSNIAEGKDLDERINHVAQLALRVVATLGQADSRLGEFADRLVDTQAKGDRLKNKTHLYIVMAQVCVVLLIAWMAAGQISLCRNSWKILSQSRCTR